MFVTRMLVRLVFSCAIAIGVTVIGASPAAAVNVDFTLKMLDFPVGQMSVGRIGGFEVHVVNGSTTTYPAVRRVIVVELDGLTRDGVSAWGRTELSKTAGGPGRVVLTDPTLTRVPAVGGSGTGGMNRMTWMYHFGFNAAAPPGTARVTFYAYNGNEIINSVSNSTTVVNPGYVRPTATHNSTPTPGTKGSPANKSPANSPTRSAPASPGSATPATSTSVEAITPNGSTTIVDGQTVAAAGTTHAAGDTTAFGSSPLAYVGGAGIVGGGAVLTWFLWRRSSGSDKNNNRNGGPSRAGR